MWLNKMNSWKIFYINNTRDSPYVFKQSVFIEKYHLYTKQDYIYFHFNIEKYISIGFVIIHHIRTNK